MSHDPQSPSDAADHDPYADDEAREGMLRAMTEQPNTEEPDVVKRARERIEIGEGRRNWYSPEKLVVAYEAGLAARPPRSEPGDKSSCPSCGALPCDWVDDPFVKSSEPGDLVLVPREMTTKMQTAFAVAFGAPVPKSPNPTNSLDRMYLVAQTVYAAVLAAAPSNPPSGQDEEVRAAEGYHGLDTSDRVCFYEQDFYVLSNFSSFEVVWAGRWKFKTAEHCYHWLRFATGPADGSLGGAWPHEDAIRIADAVRNATSAHDAFRLAQENKHLQRADWNDVKVDKMRLVIRAKADQHEYVRRKLLATGDRELIENSWRDDFWGWGPNRDGQNMLGKLWMEVRAELRKRTLADKLDALSPRTTEINQ